MKFDYKPYISEKIINEHTSELDYIQTEIHKALDNEFPGFDGIDFCDVHAGGIQIRGFHKEIMHYAFGEQITIKYDFSNYKECVDEFIDMWKAHDNANYIRGYKNFLEEGMKYGWD